MGVIRAIKELTNTDSAEGADSLCTDAPLRRVFPSTSASMGHNVDGSLVQSRADNPRLLSVQFGDETTHPTIYRDRTVHHRIHHCGALSVRRLGPDGKMGNHCCRARCYVDFALRLLVSPRQKMGQEVYEVVRATSRLRLIDRATPTPGTPSVPAPTGIKGTPYLIPIPTRTSGSRSSSAWPPGGGVGRTGRAPACRVLRLGRFRPPIRRSGASPG